MGENGIVIALRLFVNFRPAALRVAAALGPAFDDDPRDDVLGNRRPLAAQEGRKVLPRFSGIYLNSLSAAVVVHVEFC